MVALPAADAWRLLLGGLGGLGVAGMVASGDGAYLVRTYSSTRTGGLRRLDSTHSTPLLAALCSVMSCPSSWQALDLLLSDCVDSTIFTLERQYWCYFQQQPRNPALPHNRRDIASRPQPGSLPRRSLEQFLIS